jgi:hypothetical protein
MELLILSGLAITGYKLSNEKEKQVFHASKRPMERTDHQSSTRFADQRFAEQVPQTLNTILPDTNIPQNIYNFNNLQNARQIEFAKATENSHKLWSQNVNAQSNYTSEKKPNNKVDRQYSKYAELELEFPDSGYFSQQHIYDTNIPNEKTHAMANFKNMLPLVESNDLQPMMYNSFDNHNYIDEIQKQDEKKMFLEKFQDNWHNNMTPFYGGSLKQNMADRANEPLLDFYTAGNDEFKNTRQEIPNMFQPEPNNINVFGDTSQVKNLETTKERFVPSKYRQNVVPIESEKIGPGLNLPTNVVARDGWQEMTRIMPPTTNEIRTLDNPKVEYEGRTLSGKFYTTNRALLPKFTKSKQEILIENKSGERNFTTTGAYLKASLPRNYELDETNRDTNKMQVYGPAFNASMLKLSNRHSRIQKSKKNNFANTYVGPSIKDVPGQLDCPKNSYFAKSTFRQEYENQSYLSNLVSQISKSVLRPTTKLKFTRKQNYIHNPRLGEAIHRNSKSTVHFDDVAKATLKQKIAENPTSLLGVQTSVSGGAVYNPKSILKKTIKETTIDNNNPANVVSLNSGTVYDPNQKARNTLKQEIVSEFDKLNVTSASTVPKNVVFDPDIILKETIKEQTLSDVKHSNVSNINQGSRVYNPDSVMKTTLKETGLSETPLANLGVATMSNLQYDTCDPNLVTRTTMKQQTLTEAPKTNFSVDIKKSSFIDPNNKFRTTLKETNLHETEFTNYSSNGISKSIVYDPDDLTKTTNKETIHYESEKLNLRPEVSAAYRYDLEDPNNMAKVTVKQTNVTQAPMSNFSGNQNVAVYNYDDVFKPTTKETTIYEQTGSNLQGTAAGAVYNYDSKFKTTTKELAVGEAQKVNFKSENPQTTVYSFDQKAKATVKETTLDPQAMGGVSNGIAYLPVVDPNDAPKHTIKETILYPTELANPTAEITKGVVYNSNAKARITLKQQTLSETPASNLSRNVAAGSVYDPDHKFKITTKETVTTLQPHLNLSSQQRGVTVFNPCNPAKKTVKETTIQEQPLSNLQTVVSGVQVYDPCDTAKKTTKESTLGEQSLTNLQSNVSQNIVYDPCDIAKPTIKETVLSEEPLSNLSTNVSAPTIYDPNEKARATVKETTHLEDYAGNISTQELQEGAYKFLNIKPRYTTKQDIESDSKNNYFGTASSTINSSSNQVMYKNMTTNALKEKVAQGRNPTNSGPKTNITKTQVGSVSINRNSENSTQRFMKPSLLEEFEYFRMTQGDNIGIVSKISNGGTDLYNEVNMETKPKNVADVESTIDVSILDAFKSNPYTQPLDSYI